jgi:hypothetical protein
MSHLIVTAFSGGVTSSSDRDSTQPQPHSITLNAPFLHSCYLCWRHAEHEYNTTPCFLKGVFYPSVTRHLCKMHWLKLWETMLESLKARVQTQERLHDEKGRVA